MRQQINIAVQAKWVVYIERVSFKHDLQAARILFIALVGLCPPISTERKGLWPWGTSFSLDISLVRTSVSFILIRDPNGLSFPQLYSNLWASVRIMYELEYFLNPCIHLRVQWWAGIHLKLTQTSHKGTDTSTKTSFNVLVEGCLYLVYRAFIHVIIIHKTIFIIIKMGHQVVIFLLLLFFIIL